MNRNRNDRNVECVNGNWVERFYDRHTRSRVTRVVTPLGNQIGDADYSGNAATADYARDAMIRENGGAKPNLAKEPATHRGSRLKVRGACEKCGTPTNWVWKTGRSRAHWCGCE